jgi:hypothetical protein
MKLRGRQDFSSRVCRSSRVLQIVNSFKRSACQISLTPGAFIAPTGSAFVRPKNARREAQMNEHESVRAIGQSQAVRDGGVN